MGEAEFASYRGSLLLRYAEELRAATGLSGDEARATAEVHLAVPENEFHAAVHIRDAGTRDTVGEAWMQVADGDAFLVDFAIHEAFRGRGFARAAVAALEEWARGAGAHQMRLHVFAGNRRARELYEKNGFELVSLQMRKKIGPS